MVTYSNDGRNPVVRFRFNPKLIKILNKISHGFLSEDLVAKHLLIDHLIQRGLIPQDLIKEICDEMIIDYKELKENYKLSNHEYDLILKLSLEKIKNA